MSVQDTNQDADQRDRFAFLVNSVPYRSRDRQVDGREILEKSGYLPADQHILIQILEQGSKSNGLNEKVDLREEGIERFRAFPGDRIYAFTVQMRGWEWGAAAISEAELRGYVGLSDHQVFALDRTDAPDKLIEDGSEIDLDGRGAERLKVVARPLVTVKVNTKPVTLRFGWHTGAEIKTAAIGQGVDIRPDFTLDEELPNGDTQVIGDIDPTFVAGGEVFGAVDHHEDS
ncbi:MAG: multiubiquitin domain-containing protein [Xanthobacteraceae bacterium]